MTEKEEITLDEYKLTNIGIDGYYIVVLKDGTISKIYPKKEGRRTVDYIEKNGKMIKLSYEVQKLVLSSIREYERYGI